MTKFDKTILLKHLSLMGEQDNEDYLLEAINHFKVKNATQLTEDNLLDTIAFNRQIDLENAKNLGKIGKPINVYEYDMITTCCPFCNELAYEKDHCVFCGCEFQERTKEDIEEMKKANHEISVRYKDVYLHQIANSLYTFKKGVLISHSTLNRLLTQEELEEIAKEMGIEE